MPFSLAVWFRLSRSAALFSNSTWLPFTEVTYFNTLSDCLVNMIRSPTRMLSPSTSGISVLRMPGLSVIDVAFNAVSSTRSTTLSAARIVSMSVGCPLIAGPRPAPTVTAGSVVASGSKV